MNEEETDEYIIKNWDLLSPHIQELGRLVGIYPNNMKDKKCQQ